MPPVSPRHAVKGWCSTSVLKNRHFPPAELTLAGSLWMENWVWGEIIAVFLFFIGKANPCQYLSAYRVGDLRMFIFNLFWDSKLHPEKFGENYVLLFTFFFRLLISCQNFQRKFYTVISYGIQTQQGLIESPTSSLQEQSCCQSKWVTDLLGWI